MENKHIFLSILLISILMLQVVSISAISASQAREEWRNTKQESKNMREAYREANLKWMGDKTDSNNEAAIEAGKDSLNAALDEVEAWLNWKKAEVESNDEAPSELKDEILEDIDKNMGVIEELRGEVNEIQNRIQLGVTWLRMVGKYLELITDVSRNSGKIWVWIANERINNLEEFESRLREIAEEIDDNADILEKLNEAQDEIESAREDVEDAEEAYEVVVAGKRPLMSFHEGNQYLRLARVNMLNAHRNLNQATRLMRTR